ncbi:DUF3800 domain-containing protein [Bradyrhizobium sp.]
MLGAFFDDSGTHGDSPVVAMGGLLGTERQWDIFAHRWDVLLKAPLPGKPRLEQFHLYPCRRGLGEFASYNLAERDRLTYLFRRIIVDTDFVTLASAVDKKAWRELLVGELAEQVGDPLEFCFYKCVDLVIRTIRYRRPGEPVCFFFDEGTRDRIGPLAYAIRMQKNVYPEIEKIIFAPVKELIALQGADMIAYETFPYGVEWLKHGERAAANAHFKEYMKRDLSAGLIFQREHVEEMAGRIRESIEKQRRPIS